MILTSWVIWMPSSYIKMPVPFLLPLAYLKKRKKEQIVILKNLWERITFKV